MMMQHDAEARPHRQLLAAHEAATDATHQPHHSQHDTGCQQSCRWEGLFKKLGRESITFQMNLCSRPMGAGRSGAPRPAAARGL